MKKIFAILLAAALLLTAAVSFAEDELSHIKYSKSQGPYTELFEAAIIPILEAQGYTFEVVETSELLVADQLLQAGEAWMKLTRASRSRFPMTPAIRRAASRSCRRSDGSNWMKTWKSPR